MRSLVFCPYLPDSADHGGRIRTGVLLRALRELGPVAVAAPVAGGPGSSQSAQAADELGVELHPLPETTERSSPVGKIRSWLRGRSELMGRRWSAAARDSARALLKGAAHDVVVVDGSHCAPLLPPAYSGPVVAHFHNIESALLGRRDAAVRPFGERLARSVEASLCATLEKRLATRAVVSITTSHLDRQRLLALTDDARVEVVENSIDVSRASVLPLRTDAPVRLLFVGSFDYPPNREAAEELVHRHLPVLRSAHPGLCVRLVGADRAGALRGLASHDGAEVVGFVDDLQQEYREAHAVYLPIRSGGGTRIKVLEAFAYGRPVLSTAVGVEGLELESGGHYVPFEDPDGGARAVGQLSAPDVEEMVRRCRALVEQRWSHDGAVARMAQALRAALS